MLEIWINALLSGPVTHAVNITSNALVGSLMQLENFVTAAVGMARSEKSGARMTLHEAHARLREAGVTIIDKIMPNKSSTFFVSFKKRKKRPYLLPIAMLVFLVLELLELLLAIIAD